MRKSILMLLAVSGCVAEPATAAAYASTPWNIVAVLLSMVLGLVLLGSAAALAVWVMIAARVRSDGEAFRAHERKMEEVEADIRRGARSAAPRFKL